MAESITSPTPWRVQSYSKQQKEIWPKEGKHILAQYDDKYIVVYQAFCPEIAQYAVNHQKFGGPQFSYSRMSWIKTNFLWMMYRCGWATKKGQERVLAIWINVDDFRTILSQAATAGSTDVRLQWDPDHHPNGTKQIRRAIQLGLRNTVLQKYGTEWIAKIEDITDFVNEQYKFVQAMDYESLLVSEELVFPVNDKDILRQLTMIVDT